MEYVRGPSLRQLFETAARDGRPTPIAVALSIIAETADALHHAHELRDGIHGPLGLVHGDLNPDNVIVGTDGFVKIIDFGVALTSSNDTQTDGLRGSLRYMAPEQARSEGAFDRRADVYALGILLFELTTGRRLYDGADVQVLTKLVEEDVPVPSSVQSDYPRELEPMVLASLARDPRRRLSSTAALSRALHGYARGHDLTLGPETIVEHLKAVWPATADPPVRIPARPPDFVSRGDAVEVEAVVESEPPPPPTLDDLEHHEVLRDLSAFHPDAGEALRRDLFPSAHAVRPPTAPPPTEPGAYRQPGSAERVFRRPSEIPPRK
jgi:serine/threonine protein kinase